MFWKSVQTFLIGAEYFWKEIFVIGLSLTLCYKIREMRWESERMLGNFEHFENSKIQAYRNWFQKF